MSEKIDPRKVRTRHMLRDAVIALIVERGYDTITIQEITERAGLRRATFYLHYKDKEELLFAVLKETFDELVCEIEKIKFQIISEEAEMPINLIIFRHVQANAGLYHAILNGHGALTITRYIREYLIEDFLKETQRRAPSVKLNVPMEVLASFSSVIKMNMAIWWLEQGMPYSPEQMADMCSRLTLNGTRGALEIEPALADQ